jgi:hypothetical protein
MLVWLLAEVVTGKAQKNQAWKWKSPHQLELENYTSANNTTGVFLENVVHDSLTTNTNKKMKSAGSGGAGFGSWLLQVLGWV